MYHFSFFMLMICLRVVVEFESSESLRVGEFVLSLLTVSFMESLRL